MPRAWSKKDERQYEHVKESEIARGETERAEEIAARTVNKQRREEGRTLEQKEARRGGKPSGRLDDRTVVELRTQARKLHVRGYSHMRKAELIDAIREAS